MYIITGGALQVSYVKFYKEEDAVQKTSAQTLFSAQ